MARTDDIINCAPTPLSTGAMEEVCASHPDVAEAAVIGCAGRYQGPGALRLSGAEQRCNEAERTIEKEVIDLVRHYIGPVAAFKLATCVKRLSEDALGQGAARDDAEDRRWRDLEDAARSRTRGAGRNRGGAEGARPAASACAVRMSCKVGRTLVSRESAPFRQQKTRLDGRVSFFSCCRPAQKLSSSSSSLRVDLSDLSLAKTASASSDFSSGWSSP